MNVTKTVISVGADRLLLTIHATPDSEHVYLGSAERFYAYTQVIHPLSPFYAAMGHSDATLVRIQYNMVKTARFQEKKRLIPWISMKQEIQVPLSFPVPDEELRQMYESAVTWQDFFGPLRSRIGEDEFCMFVAPWLHRFLLMMVGFNFSGVTYRIPFDSAKIPRIIYTCEGRMENPDA